VLNGITVLQFHPSATLRCATGKTISIARKTARQNNPKLLAFCTARGEIPDKSDSIGEATVVQNDVSNNRCQGTKDLKGASDAQLTI